VHTKVKTDFDVVVVGSGPNGLAAAITMQAAGLSTLIIEAKETIGGGLRTAELTLPGYKHDVCSAIHPMGSGSPFFNKIPLDRYGLKYIHPPYAVAHPFDDGSAATVETSLENTASLLGHDNKAYQQLIKPLVSKWPSIAADVLGPIGIPKSPVPFINFGLKAVQSAHSISKRFTTKEAKGLWAGVAGHSLQPLTNVTSAAIGLVLLTQAHLGGWPMPQGGSQQIANALAEHFVALGGRIETNQRISSLSQLPSYHALLLDVTPKQLLELAGHRFSSVYKWQLSTYKYGMGVFKIDWALDSPVPFTNEKARSAGTVHLGNTYEEIAYSEQTTWKGKHAETPYVLLAQQSIFDPSRAPIGKHTAWAYCHVPNGSTVNMTQVIENQVERFAKGFKDRILAKHVMNTAALQNYNANYIGGDINGGAINLTQLFTRPALRSSPYRTSTRGIYICSASTPPGGGVHGMCGYHSAKRALQDIFQLKSVL
jgi:phytoene dehydrogenase-like protein